MLAWVAWTCVVSLGSYLAGWIGSRRHLFRFQRRQLEEEERAFSREDLEEADALAPGSRPLAEYRYGPKLTAEQLESCQQQQNAAQRILLDQRNYFGLRGQ